MNATKLSEVVKTPRVVNDERYDSLGLDYVKYTDTLTFIKWGGAIVAILFGVLGFLGITSYTLAFLGVATYLGVFLVNKFYVDKQNTQLNRKAAEHAQASAVAVVQRSEYYGVVVFAKNDKTLQSNTQNLLEIASKLREIGEEEASNDPVIKHVQNRLWDTQNYFDAEELDAEVVGSNGVWWKVESMSSSSIPDSFNESKDTLIGFIKDDDDDTYLSLVDNEFYKKYL